jgi:hypothetical protein
MYINVKRAVAQNFVSPKRILLIFDWLVQMVVEPIDLQVRPVFRENREKVFICFKFPEVVR